MIRRYSLPDMAAIWTEENRFRRMLDVEIAAAESMADAGLVPKPSARRIRKKAAFKISEIDAFEKQTKHDVTAFLKSVGKRLGKDARFVHMGLTSSDVVDTGFSLQIGDAIDQILCRAIALKEAVRVMSLRYKDTPAIGRTHGIHAEPTTFGLKLLLYFEELKRQIVRLERARENIAFGKLSGAVGTNASVAPSIERKTMKRLGLRVAPVSTQVLQRDRHAEVMSALALLAGTLEKMSIEIRHLQRTEVREVEESFSKGQTGSSAMPHKKNPVNAERVSGLARVVRSNLIAALENIPLWHERDISHSSVERMIFPDSFGLVDFMLVEMTRIIEGLNVHPNQMLANIEKTRGLVFSQRLLLALIKKNMARFEAYKIVQGLSMQVWNNGTSDLKSLAAMDRRVSKHLSAKELNDVFNMNHYLKHVGQIYRRVLNK